MATARVVGDKFLAQCQKCGTWHEVQPQQDRCDAFFSYWVGAFICCDQEQKASFAREKDEIDFH